MNFEDLHNELNEFPEDLNYSDAKWQGALELIEAHEAKVANRKKLAALVCSAVLVSCAFMFYPFGKNIYADYSPREWNDSTAQTEFIEEGESIKIKAENSATLVQENSEAQLAFSDVDQKENTNLIETPHLQLDENSQKLIEQETKEAISANAENQELRSNEHGSSSSDMKFADNTGRKNVVDSKLDKNISETKQAADNGQPFSETSESETILKKETGATPPNDAAEPKEVITPVLDPSVFMLTDSKGTEPIFSDNSYSGKTNSVSEPANFTAHLPKRSAYLNITMPRKQLVSDKKVMSGDKTFRIYREYIGSKLGINPLADYGRAQLQGGVNPSAGVFYERTVSEKFFWNAGVEYFSLNAIDLSVSSENTTYNYGFESNVLIVHTDRAHFLSLPVYVGFRPIKRVQFKTGFSANVLLETQNTLEEHNISNKESNVLSQTKTSGYRTSFNSLGFTGSTALNYWISERTSIQFTYHLGVSDFSNNQAFGNENRDRNTRFELSINKVLR